MEFSRQEYWSGLPCPSPGALPNPGMEPRSSTLQADFLPSEHQGSSELSLDIVECPRGQEGARRPESKTMEISGILCPVLHIHTMLGERKW